LTSAGDVAAVESRLGLPVLIGAEEAVARRLEQQWSGGESRLGEFAEARWNVLLPGVDARLPHRLSRGQRDAVEVALSSKVSVLTGGPGTGKTTALRAVLHLAQDASRTVALAAPTGRAARRMSEATGRPAKTIHRLLEFSPFEDELFGRGPDNPVDADLVVIDEASMVDTLLMHALMRGLHSASHLVLVGDSDQLPSVGAGNVLADLLASEQVPVVRLDEVHRQAAGSDIVLNAHRVNRGELPEFPAGSRDFFLFREEDAEQAASRAVEVATQRIPRKFGLDAAQDIQVLAPMHRGAAGVRELNRRLQEALNPPTAAPELRMGDASLRVGDRVMQTKNDYVREVFNGDQGIVSAVLADSAEIQVTFDGREVSYPFADADALMLAYACSVHKSQGSEYPAVVLVLVGAHYVMLQRNLLYTALTRARQLCVIVGSPRALRLAVANDRPAVRHTLLRERLLRSGDQS
jgi:exodeoxyribonuclease V alpha subunit